MSTTNYLFEANLGLIFFSVVYFLLLHRETQFNVKRAYLLGAMLASVVFPLIDVQSLVPQIATSTFTPEVYLPEVMIGGYAAEPANNTNASGLNLWAIALWIYITVTGFLLIRFIVQLGKLFTYLKRQNFYSDGNFSIAETTASSTFSFFHYIIVGNADHLAEREKQKIIQHEKTHAKRLHSFDIILTELFIIAFWFNPLVYIMKKQLISVHEFEADQKSIENSDVETYCTMLARVSLLSAGFTFVNHFNNSLTLKRIAMINTHKTKMGVWKYAAILLIFIVGFLADACSDPSLSLVKSSPQGLNLPGEIRTLLENETYNLPDGTPTTKLQDLEAWKTKNPDAEFIIEKVQEVQTPESSKALTEHVINLYKKEYKKAEGFISHVAVVSKKNAEGKWAYSYIIHGMTDHKTEVIPETKNGKRIYEAVEVPPSYVGGVEAMKAYLAKEIKYPSLAIANKTAGNVFISFIVDSEGNVTDPYILRGIGYGCDEEALSAVAGFPKWKPGMQKGIAVNVRYIIPVNFQLSQATAENQPGSATAQKLNITVNSKKEGEKIIVEGKITGRSTGQPLGRAFVILVDGANGVSSDSEGNFRFETTKTIFVLAISADGYETQYIKSDAFIK